jgi:Domain of unknown function (DUF4157)
VTRIGPLSANKLSTQVSSAPFMLQRKCGCGQHTVAGAECDQCKKRELNVQRSRNGGAAPTAVPPIVHDVLRAPGQPLDLASRRFFEPRFARDFSSVRVHSDPPAAASARAVNALAYTVGNNIVFANGQYSPRTPAGRHLLAHELVHTVQQQRASPTLSRAPDNNGSLDEPRLESEAEAVASEMTSDENEEATETASSDPMHDAIALNEARPAHAPTRRTPKPAPRHGLKKPKSKPKPKANPCTRNIFFEGTCQDLVTGAADRCCDPANGLPNPGREKDVEGKPCPDHKFTPMFTCDNTCSKALKKGCSDSDNWLALPRNQFTRGQCGDIWTICANGKKTQAYVREKSVTKDKFEVGQRVVRDLGVPADTFKGATYKPGADPKKIENDRCCSPPTKHTSVPEPTFQPGRTGLAGGIQQRG